MNSKKYILRAGEASGFMEIRKITAGGKSAGSSFFACILCLFLIFSLCGCSLAVLDAGEESREDRMIGVLITREFLDMLSAQGTEGFPPDTDRGIRSSHDGKLYAEIDKSKGEDPAFWEISFGDLDGIQMLTPLWTMENGESCWGNVCTEGISDLDIRYNVLDDGEERSISGTIYIVSGNGNKPTAFYANPVYQTADGNLYVSQGRGVSASGDSPEGMEFSSALSEETTVTENGKTKTETSSLNVRYTFMDRPVRIKVCQMDSRHRVLKEEDYRPEDMPQELAAEADAEYILVETEKEGPSGEKTVSREAFSLPAEGELYLTSYRAREDGIVVKQETDIL